MKSPLNASSAPPAPRDMDTATAGQLSELYSHITALNQQMTETREQLSTIVSHVVCFKEQLELVHAAIERLEQSFVTQGNWDAGDQTSIPQATVTMNLNQSIPDALTSPRRYQSVNNRNNPESPTSRSGGPPVAVTSPRFITRAPPPSPCSPSVNTSLDGLCAASPPTHLNVLLFKTPQQVVSDLASISDAGTFYIVTKGREPGIYTDWPKAEALVRGLRHSVYCKKYGKSHAIQVYTDAYEEKRLERVFK